MGLQPEWLKALWPCFQIWQFVHCQPGLVVHHIGAWESALILSLGLRWYAGNCSGCFFRLPKTNAAAFKILSCRWSFACASCTCDGAGRDGVSTLLAIVSAH